jgi:hypothetical protein
MGTFDGSTKEVEKNDLVRKGVEEDLTVGFEDLTPRQDYSEYAESLYEDPIIENKSFELDDDMLISKGPSFLESMEEKNWKERVGAAASDLMFDAARAGMPAAGIGGAGGAAIGAARAKKGERMEGAKRGALIGAGVGGAAGTAGFRGLGAAFRRSKKARKAVERVGEKNVVGTTIGGAGLVGAGAGGALSNRKKTPVAKELDDSMIVEKSLRGVAAHTLGGAAIGAGAGAGTGYVLPGSKDQKRRAALILGAMGGLTGAGIGGAAKYMDDGARHLNKLKKESADSFKKVKEDTMDTFQDTAEGLNAARRGDEKAMERAFNRRISADPKTDIDVTDYKFVDRGFGGVHTKNSPYEAFVGKGLFSIEVKETARETYARRFKPDQNEIKITESGDIEGSGRASKDIRRAQRRSNPPKWKNTSQPLVEALDDETIERSAKIRERKLLDASRYASPKSSALKPSRLAKWGKRGAVGLAGAAGLVSGKYAYDKLRK